MKQRRKWIGLWVACLCVAGCDVSQEQGERPVGTGNGAQALHMRDRGAFSKTSWVTLGENISTPGHTQNLVMGHLHGTGSQVHGDLVLYVAQDPAIDYEMYVPHLKTPFYMYPTQDPEKQKAYFFGHWMMLGDYCPGIATDASPLVASAPGFNGKGAVGLVFRPTSPSGALKTRHRYAYLGDGDMAGLRFDIDDLDGDGLNDVAMTYRVEKTAPGGGSLYGVMVQGNLCLHDDAVHHIMSPSVLDDTFYSAATALYSMDLPQVRLSKDGSGTLAVSGDSTKYGKRGIWFYTLNDGIFVQKRPMMDVEVYDYILTGEAGKQALVYIDRKHTLNLAVAREENGAFVFERTLWSDEGLDENAIIRQGDINHDGVEDFVVGVTRQNEGASEIEVRVWMGTLDAQRYSDPIEPIVRSGELSLTALAVGMYGRDYDRYTPRRRDSDDVLSPEIPELSRQPWDEIALLMTRHDAAMVEVYHVYDQSQDGIMLSPEDGQEYDVVYMKLASDEADLSGYVLPPCYRASQCMIDDKCYESGALNPEDPSAWCDPTKHAFDWTTEKDICEDILSECKQSHYDSSTGECTWTPAPDGTVCMDNTCSDGAVEYGLCASGVCQRSSVSCGNYRCESANGAASCLKSCDSDDDCVSGYLCKTAISRCIADAGNHVPVVVLVASSGGNSSGYSIQIGSGDEISFDFSKSYDADFDALSYSLSCIQATTGDVVHTSASQKSSTSEFVEPGKYVCTAFVSDGRAESDKLKLYVTVVSVENDAPVVSDIVRTPTEEGVSVRVNPGQVVTLDASQTVDPDGDALTYEWIIYPRSRTKGISFVSLGDQIISWSMNEEAASNPEVLRKTGSVVEWTPEILGLYTAFVTVTDTQGNEAYGRTLKINVHVGQDEPPVVVASVASDRATGEFVSVHPGEILTFDAFGSYDPEGGALTYQWWGWGLDSDQPVAKVPAHSMATTDSLSYIYSVTVSDEAGNENIGEVRVEITPWPPSNEPPVAVVAPRFYAMPGESVVVDASASYDPDGDFLYYLWAGDLPFPDVYEATPVLQIPADAPLGTQYTLTLSLFDGNGGEDRAEVEIIVGEPPHVDENLPPVILLDAPAEARVGEKILVDASRSFDPEGTALSFAWTVTCQGEAGEKHTSLDDGRGESTAFVLELGERCTVTVVVTDQDGISATDQAVIEILLPEPSQNHPPVAVLPSWYTAQAGATVAFDASASFDPDGDPFTFAWVSASDIDFSRTDGAFAEFSVPSDARVGQTFSITLVLQDIHGAVGLAEATIEVVMMPTDPTDPSNPTDPTDPTDPSNPTDPTDPTDPSNPDIPPVPDVAISILMPSDHASLELYETTPVVFSGTSEFAEDVYIFLDGEREPSCHGVPSESGRWSCSVIMTPPVLPTVHTAVASSQVDRDPIADDIEFTVIPVQVPGPPEAPFYGGASGGSCAQTPVPSSHGAWLAMVSALGLLFVRRRRG